MSAPRSRAISPPSGGLIDLLADTPTPAGHTPRQIGAINNTTSRETKDAEQ
jgi:hypothetical protein